MDARNQDGLQSRISLQEAVALMISNPQAAITNQPLASVILHEALRNDERRSDSQGQHQQERNYMEENHSSRRTDTQGQQRCENSDSQRCHHSPERHEQIRNELAENDTTLVPDKDLQADTMDNRQHSGNYLKNLLNSSYQYN
ncbi:hypothetical protein CHS0354_012550 [Potamilus streckersoni]|uniref:Uncharacterized protein n=1 Tax=Potamilus streckersoni TaxID=2493646 RepID=A0AAE0S2H1_9BIVA|nr:hypothetical protein CHS0354_012550 [Potamilus streckersoni]